MRGLVHNMRCLLWAIWYWFDGLTFANAGEAGQLRAEKEALIRQRRKHGL